MVSDRDEKCDGNEGHREDEPWPDFHGHEPAKEDDKGKEQGADVEHLPLPREEAFDGGIPAERHGSESDVGPNEHEQEEPRVFHVSLMKHHFDTAL